MTDRERLIELIGKVQDEGLDYSDVVCVYKTSNERLADYLLANGVRLETEQATSEENKRWIPVTERLPDVGGIYLVVVKYKYDFEKEFNYDTDVATFHFGYDCGYIDGQWNTYVDWDEGQQYLHVTHWMPLPEPPEG